MDFNQLEQVRAESNEAQSIADSKRVNVPAWMKFVLLLLLVCTGAVTEAVCLSSVSGDLWIHLRSGLWMLQNHAIPRTGLFSQNADASWMDLHWLLQLSLAVLYKAVGVRAIPFIVMCAKAAVAVCVYVLARHNKAAFLPSFIIAAIAVFIIDRTLPFALLSACFFALVLLLIERFREHHDLKRVWTVAPIFVLWANVDSGFIYGLLLLALFALACLVTSLIDSRQAWSQVGKTFGLLGIGAVSTLVTPYFASTWSAAFTELFSDTAIRRFAELRPMAFRSQADFVAMLFVMGSMVVLGLRRRCDLFHLTIITLSMVVAFRFQREFWLVTLCCVAAVSDAIGTPVPSAQETSGRLTSLKLASISAVLVILVTAALSIPRDVQGLVAKAHARLPLAACDAIRSAHLQPPLLHTFGWGAFIAYYLPEYPVVIDTRVGLYGDEWNEHYFNLLEGRTRLDQDATGLASNTLLVEKDSAIAKAILNLPQLSAQFRVFYQDDLSIVFVRN